MNVRTLAVGRTTGEVLLHKCGYPSTFDVFSLEIDPAQRRRPCAHTERVPQTTLDNEFPVERPGAEFILYVKIDVEGATLNALAGMSKSTNEARITVDFLKDRNNAGPGDKVRVEDTRKTIDRLRDVFAEYPGVKWCTGPLGNTFACGVKIVRAERELANWRSFEKNDVLFDDTLCKAVTLEPTGATFSVCTVGELECGS